MEMGPQAMIPDQQLSSVYIQGDMLPPDNVPYKPLHSYERGGVALQDPSQGLNMQDWHCFYDVPSQTVMIEAENTETPIALFTREGVVHLSFCFDQNMRYSCAYTLADGSVEFRWYDSQVEMYVVTVLPVGTQYPFLSLDDKRQNQLSASDIILTYLKPSLSNPGYKALYFRAQRERFLIEHLLADKMRGDIYNFGMTNKWRVQWDIFDFDSSSSLVLDDSYTNA